MSIPTKAVTVYAWLPDAELCPTPFNLASLLSILHVLTILFVCYRFFPFWSSTSQLRVYFYLIMATIQDDVAAQQRGAVKISYCVDETDNEAISPSVQSGSVCTSQTDSKNKNPSVDLDLMYSLATLQRCLPIRFASLHYFYSDPSVQEMYNTARLALGKDVRVRSRAFDGMLYLAFWEYVASSLPL